MSTDSASCVACHGSLKFFGPRSNYKYYCCDNCGTIQLFPIPNKAEMDQAYLTSYSDAKHYEGNPVTCRLSGRSYYNKIVQVLKDYNINGLVVDYGSGWGGLCEMMIDNGFQCIGTEVSEDMVSYCRKQGIPIQHGDIETLQEAVKDISALVMCAVFEHLTNHNDWLKCANKLVKDNGYLVSLQPTAPFAYFTGTLLRLGNKKKSLPQLLQFFCPPWHTVFFSFKGMRKLLSRNGFELLEIRPAPQGRMKGLMGIIQFSLELFNIVGWRLIGGHWPLLTAHIFIFKKVQNVNIDCF